MRPTSRVVRTAAAITAVALSLLAVGVVLAASSDAHALLSHADPAPGSTLSRAPTRVVITFTEQPDAALSSIQVLDRTGKVLAGGKPQPVAGAPAMLAVEVGALGRGVYTVSWRTVSKVDGHLAIGSYSFGVGEAPSSGAATTATVTRSPRPSTLAVVARWLFLLGVIGLVGVAFVTLFVVRDAPSIDRRIDRASGAAWLAAIVGAIAITEAQRRAAGLSVGDVWSSSLAHSLWLRLVPLLVAGGALLIVVFAPRCTRRWAVAMVGVAGLVAMLEEVRAGHAAAQPGWEWFRVTTQWVHVAAAGVWIGGLAALLVVLGALDTGERRRAARRYSGVAAFALLAVVASGVLRAVDEIGSWHELLHTGFGQVVLIKVALLGVLVVLGALNRYRSVPVAGEAPVRLRRVGSVEIVVATIVLLATGVLVNLAPARSATTSAARPNPPIVIDAHDFATTVRLHLVVSPGGAGFDHYSATIHDYDTGQGIAGAAVSLRFSLPSRPDVGASTLALRDAGAGRYDADASNLSLDGNWDVDVLVQHGATPVEIPVAIATRPQDQQLAVQRATPTLTVYTATLPNGTSVETYLQPQRAGTLNEFHITVIEPGGASEVPMSNVTVYTSNDRGGSASNLTVRRLDPEGHFVADLVNPVRATWTFDITGTTKKGAVVRAVIGIPLP